jgi:hypothetical protein
MYNAETWLNKLTRCRTTFHVSVVISQSTVSAQLPTREWFQFALGAYCALANNILRHDGLPSRRFSAK